jgi:hypothetical protein
VSNEVVFEEDYTPYVAVFAEGMRIALTTCKLCGAALVFSGFDTLDPLVIHKVWHNKTDHKKRVHYTNN